MKEEGGKDDQRCPRAGEALGPAGSEQKFASEGLTALRNCRGTHYHLSQADTCGVGDRSGNVMVAEMMRKMMEPSQIVSPWEQVSEVE